MFLSNALASAAVGHALQLTLEDIKQGLEQFQPMPGRMERISMDGAMIINDAYNANPVSMERSLQVLAAAQQGSRKIAVLGDMCELGKQAAEYHRQDHYSFHGEALGVRIARKHLGWYTKDLDGGDVFRREINAAQTSAVQLAAVGRFFDTLAQRGERLVYRQPAAAVVDATCAFGRSGMESQRGGEALAA